MNRLSICLLFIAATIGPAFGQARGSAENSKTHADEARRAALAAVREIKADSRITPTLEVGPLDFYDGDSFGKSVIFLGSLYAGTVYVADLTGQTVNANGCPTTPPNNFAPDDYCFNKAPGVPMPVPTPGGAFIEVFDPAWQITIPGNTVKNVIYPMLNNTVSVFSTGTTTGPSSVVYTPRITIVSDALNDPLAINPDGTPMNGSFTTSLTGTYFRSSFVPSAGPFTSETQNYASVAGRGISRAFWRTVGLPDSVINNIYKKPMTLKFGIRFRLSNSPDEAIFFYTFRLIGQ